MATVSHINSTKHENISAKQEGSIGVLLASCVEIILCLLGPGFRQLSDNLRNMAD